MIQNIKISLNLLLIVILSIVISNILPELPALLGIVEAEEVKEFEIHIEANLHQNNIQSTGTGGEAKIDLSLNIFSKGFEFQPRLKPENIQLSIGEHPLNSIPFFILYCSLIVYS